MRALPSLSSCRRQDPIWEINKNPSPRLRTSPIFGGPKRPISAPKPSGKGGGLRPPPFPAGFGVGRGRLDPHDLTISGSGFKTNKDFPDYLGLARVPSFLLFSLVLLRFRSFPLVFGPVRAPMGCSLNASILDATVLTRVRVNGFWMRSPAARNCSFFHKQS